MIVLRAKRSNVFHCRRIVTGLIIDPIPTPFRLHYRSLGQVPFVVATPTPCTDPTVESVSTFLRQKWSLVALIFDFSKSVAAGAMTFNACYNANDHIDM